MLRGNKRTKFPKDTILENVNWTDLDIVVETPGLIQFFMDISKCLDNRDKLEILSMKYPIYSLLRKLMNTETFLTTVPKDSIKELNDLLNILMDMDSEHQEDEIDNIITSVDEVNIISNNQIKKQMKFEFSKETEIPTTWISMKHIKRKPSFIITSQNANGYEIKAELISIIENEHEHFYKIDTIIPTMKQVQITCPDLTEIKNLMEFVKKEKAEWDVKMTIVAMPQILIRGVTIKINNKEDWVSRFCRQNGFKDDGSSKILHITNGKGKFYGTYNIYMEISQHTRDLIQEKLGTIYVFSQRLHVIDYFNIQICGKCLLYGHQRNRCDGKRKRCPFGCVIAHDTNEICPRSLDIHKQKCPNCYQIGHSAFDKKCPIYIEKLEREIAIRNYPYDWVML